MIKKVKYLLTLLTLSVVVGAYAQDNSEYNGLKAGDMCPDYVFLKEDGMELVFLNAFNGKFIYIDVWATWCQPCKEEFPAFNTLKEEFSDDNIVFLQISCDKGRYRQWWQQNRDQYELTEPQWIISEADGFMQGFEVAYVPRFILIGPDGRVVDEKMTRPSDPETRGRLRELLDNAPEKPAGIDFLDVSFNDALLQAEAEGKTIFIDGYTTWCGPCRTMDRTILSEPEVYEFMNDNFVNLKIDMEKGEGPQIAQRYGIDSYPSYLLVKSDASLQSKFTGLTRTTGEFLDKIKTGMASEGEVNLRNLKKIVAEASAPSIEGGSFEAFDQRLTDILQRRDRNATVKDVQEITTDIEASGLAEKQHLADYAGLVSANLRRDVGGIVTGLEKMGQVWDNDKINSRFFGAANTVATVGNDAEKTSLRALINILLQRDDLTNASQSLELFRDSMLQ